MFAHPWWLAALALLPLVRWLHRFRSAAGAERVAALFLWRDDAVPDAHGAQAAPPDPAWRRRALVVVLLALALAGPRLPATLGAPVVVWIDDSQSMYAREGSTTRMEEAVAELDTALAHARPVAIELRSLADPAAMLPLAGDVSRAHALADWTRTPRGEPRPPPAATLDPHAEHWLVTDAADAALVRWASAAPLSRIVQQGDACANAAVTALTLRASLAAGGPTAGLVEITNACAAPAPRRLRVTAGDAVLVDEEIALAPEGSEQRRFTAPVGARVRAALDAGDALALDDALEVDGAALLPVATHLTGACTPALQSALRAHPRLAFDAGDPVLEIACGEDSDLLPRSRHVRLRAGDDPVQGPLSWQGTARFDELVLDAAWLRRARATPAGRAVLDSASGPLILRTDEGVDAALAFGAPPFSARPEHAALLSGLIDLALDRELLGEIVAMRLDAAAARIAPLPLPAVKSARPPLPSAQSLVGWLTAAALIALLYDLARTSRWLRRAARLAIALLCALALWNPPNPWSRAPVDLAVLLDASASMPAAAVERAWQAVRSQALPPGSRARVVRFGGDAVVEGVYEADALPATAPARHAVDAERTDVAAALALALDERDAGRTVAVALASDGEQNAGDAEPLLAQARAAGVPVMLIDTAGESPPTAAIGALYWPPNARAGERVPLGVGITSPDAARLEVEDGGRVATMPVAAGGRVLQLWLEPDARRSRTIDLRLLAADGRALDRRSARLDLDGKLSVLVVARTPSSALAESLSAGGWRVATVAPDALGQALADGAPHDVIVLDDVAIDGASATAWDTLADGVRRGTGLAVLGGPHSFAAGGYRDSTLESLLPVISAPPRTQAAAAVLFVVDRSGSMGRTTSGGVTRLVLAREAVLRTARELPPGDAVGLLAFDAQPAVVQPLAAGGAGTLEAAWTFGAHGGTALAPALERAVGLLEASDPEQRVLVLATDGFLLDQPLGPLLARIDRAGIDVVALAIGDEADLRALEELAAVNDGALLAVGDIATLPRLMSGELARRRAAVERETITPQPRGALPFFDVASWPPIEAYAVTTARPEARTHLVSPAGDPLIATGHAGAGRVLVVTSGLDAWAPAWQTWPRLPDFVGGLADWLRGRPAARVYARLDETGDEARVAIDAADGETWSIAPSARVTWVDAEGSASTTVAPLSAPGRYIAHLPRQSRGLHAATIEVAGARTTLPLERTENREHRPHTGIAERWRARQWVTSWPEGLAAVLRPAGRLRDPLLVLVLGAFLVLLLGERWPWSRAAPAQRV